MAARLDAEWQTKTSVGRGEKAPTPKISALLRKRPALLRANFVLTKDRKRPFNGLFCSKVYTGRGLVVKRPGILSKVQMLNLVLGVGVFSLLPSQRLQTNSGMRLARFLAKYWQKIRDREPRTIPTKGLPHQVVFWGGGVRIVRT